MQKERKRIYKLITRLGNIQVFDPACGSGNFLLVAYEYIKDLEIECLELLEDLEGQGVMRYSNVSLDNFRGIEIDHFGVKLTRLLLCVKQAQKIVQMNRRLGNVSEKVNLLPLEGIKQGNSIQEEWDYNRDKEIYLVGNPPFRGVSWLTDDQRNDMVKVFGSAIGDYVLCWFKLACQYMENRKNVSGGLISTSSICEGNKVLDTWKKLLIEDIEISFAYSSFQWSNKATNNAGVSCVVIGLEHKSDKKKFLVDRSNIKQETDIISPFLKPYHPPESWNKSSNMLCDWLPACTGGVNLHDGGTLQIKNIEEYKRIIQDFPESKKYLRRFMNGHDLINGIVKYVLWISDKELEEAKDIPWINNRLEGCKKFRYSSSGMDTQKFKDKPHLPIAYNAMKKQTHNTLAWGVITSEKRKWLIADFYGSNVIFTNKCFVIQEAPIWMLSLIGSAMHMIWTKEFGGRLCERISYNNSSVWNTFPFPNLNNYEDSRDKLESLSKELMKSREIHHYNGLDLGEMYDDYNKKTMPDDIKNIHQQIDEVIEEVYLKELGREEPFKDDLDRLKAMFEYYETLKAYTLS